MFAPPSALSVDWQAHETALAELPQSFTQDGQLAGIARVHELLERGRTDLLRLGQMLNEPEPLTLDSAQRLVTMADQASTIPDIEREALVSQVWDRGIESIAQLVDAVEKVQQAYSSLEHVFRDVAWSTELEEARGHLAVMGTNWLRFFSGNWRRANRLIKSLCVSPGKQTRDELLQSLDQLMSAQAARKVIDYLEDRIRRSTVGRSHGVSIRIAKGVYYRTGAFEGHPVERTERVHVGTGWLIPTTKHVYFASPTKSFRIAYGKIVALDPYEDGMGLMRDAATAKPQIFVFQGVAGQAAR